MNERAHATREAPPPRPALELRSSAEPAGSRGGEGVRPGPGASGPPALDEESPRTAVRDVSGDGGATPRRSLDAHDRMVAAIRSRAVPEDLLAAGFRIESHAVAALDYTYRGAAGWQEWLSDLLEVFAGGARFEVGEIIAAGDDFVAAMYVLAGRSVYLGERFELRWGGVTWFRDGQVLRTVAHASRDTVVEVLESHLRG